MAVLCVPNHPEPQRVSGSSGAQSATAALELPLRRLRLAVLNSRTAAAPAKHICSSRHQAVYEISNHAGGDSFAWRSFLLSRESSPSLAGRCQYFPAVGPTAAALVCCEWEMGLVRGLMKLVGGGSLHLTITESHHHCELKTLGFYKRCFNDCKYLLFCLFITAKR